MSEREGTQPTQGSPAEFSAPAGDYGKSRVLGILFARELGEQLVGTNPEVAELYIATGLSYSDIARQVIPGIASSFPRVAEVAVGNAVRGIIPPEELGPIVARKRAAAMEALVASRSADEQREHQSAAGKRRQKLHGPNVEAMVRGRGRTMWSENEKSLAVALSRFPEFQSKSPHHKGEANHEDIALALNELFHDGREVRRKGGVNKTVNALKRKQAEQEK